MPLDYRPAGSTRCGRRLELQAGQRGLPADSLGGRRHARQGELTGDGLGIAANLLADGLGGRRLARVHAGDCS